MGLTFRIKRKVVTDHGISLWNSWCWNSRVDPDDLETTLPLSVRRVGRSQVLTLSDASTSACTTPVTISPKIQDMPRSNKEGLWPFLRSTIPEQVRWSTNGQMANPTVKLREKRTVPTGHDSELGESPNKIWDGTTPQTSFTSLIGQEICLI